MRLHPDRGRRSSVTRAAAVTTAAGGLLASTFVAVPAAVAAELPTPAVHYTFDDAPGATVRDVSGAGRDGTLANPGTATSVAGVEGQALGLPGGAASAGAHVALPASVLEGATDVTVSQRVRWDGTGGAWQWMSALGAGGSRYLFTTPSNDASLLRSAITTTGGPTEDRVTGSAALPSGRWVTVTTVLDTAADRLTTYLDGAEVGSTATTITAADLRQGTGATGGYIGRSFYPDPLFRGAVDDFQVFHTALSDEQVAELVPGEVPTRGDLAQTSLDLRTVVGTAPALPATLPAAFSDGYARPVDVVWEAVPADRYARPGTFAVRGDAEGTTVTATVTVVREGQLEIDLGETTGEFTGGASGLLYGLYADGMPTDELIEGMGVQTVATKGQDGAQHPGSDALEVLPQLARTTDGDIYVRTTDFYRGFPYQWPGDTPEEKLEGYFEVMGTQLDDIAALDPALLENVVIEPFNEPEGNMFGTGEWSYDRTSWLDDPTDFFAAWDRAHALITEKLPGVRVAGPGTSILFGQNRGFLEHTVEAGTAPDIITWHELSDPATVRSSVARYRAWEREVHAGTAYEGVETPININEYAFNYHTSVPGQMIQWISAIEESKVQAMIAFWNINGNLSDSAVQSNRGNGQWWLYNAYSRMTGETVAVTPPSPGQSYTLQGVATLDEERRTARAILGGADGPSYVQVSDVPADVMGDEVRVTVREIPWTGQLGSSAQPRHLAELVVPVVDGAVGLDFGGAELPELDEASAYEVVVTPAGVGETTAEQPISFEGSYEAEDARTTGAGFTVNGPEGSPTNQGGFYTSGGRNVGGLRTGSDGVMDFTVDVPEDGTYDLQVFASTLNTFERVREDGPTNVFVRVDGAAEQELFLPLSYKWVVWDHADTTVELTAGRHTISLAARSLDGTGATRGDAIVDRIVLQKPTPSAGSSVYEAELAELDGAVPSYEAPAGVEDARVSGAGTAVLEQGDEAVFWAYGAIDGPASVTVDVAGAGAADVLLGERVVGSVEGTATLPVSLAGGVNKITVRGTGGTPLHLDRLVVTEDADALTTTVVQAEDGTLAGDARVVELGLAEGGRAVDGIGGAPGNGSTLSVQVEAAEAGPHAVAVRFSNPEQVPATHYNPNPMGRFADITVNDGEPQREWFVPSFHENQFFERTVVLDLAAGTNTVTFSSEEQPNWDGETYIEDLWPGLYLRPELAPVLDRLTFSPLSGEPVAEGPDPEPDPEPEVATDVSVLDLLRRDRSGPELRRADGDDFDLLRVAVERVLRQRPDSPVAVLADPTRRATVLMPDDTAFTAALEQVAGRDLRNEVRAADVLRSRSQVRIELLERVLLGHVVPGTTLTSERVLRADGRTLTTAAGTTLTVRVEGPTVSLLDADGDVVATRPAGLDLNRGQAQVGHAVGTVVGLG